jgi:hypothetical protein
VAFGGEQRYLDFLGTEIVPVFGSSMSTGFSGGAKLLVRSFVPGRGAKDVESFEGCPEVMARVGDASLAAESGSVREVQAGVRVLRGRRAGESGGEQCVGVAFGQDGGCVACAPSKLEGVGWALQRLQDGSRCFDIAAVHRGISEVYQCQCPVAGLPVVRYVQRTDDPATAIKGLRMSREPSP